MGSLPSDTFAGVFDASLWVKGSYFTTDEVQAVTVAQANSLVTITPISTADGYNGYYSVGNFDLTNGVAFVKLATAPPSSAAASDAFFFVGPDSNNWIRIAVEGGFIFAQHMVAGVKTLDTSVAYSATSHKYLRIRHGTYAGGTGDNIYFDTWNGTTLDANGNPVWTNLFTLARPTALTITACKAEIDGGTYTAQASPGTIVWDNFNTYGADVPGPTITSITPTPNDTGVTVTWTTNIPGSSILEWGPANGAVGVYGNSTTETDTNPRVNTHTKTISGLSPGSDYHFRVTSTGGSGNTSTSTDQTFHTTGTFVSFHDAIMADGPTANWPMSDTGTVMAATVGPAGTYIGTVTHGIASPIPGDATTATRFSGAGAAQANLDLSAYNKSAVECMFYWDAYADDDRMLFELSDATGGFQSVNGLMILPNSSFDHNFESSQGNSTGLRFNGGYFNRPSAGAWHHGVWNFDRAGGVTAAFIDGQQQPFTYVQSGTDPSNFGSLIFNIMSRHGNSLFGSGILKEVTVYAGVNLTQAQISNHFSKTGLPAPPPPSATVTFHLTPDPATNGNPYPNSMSCLYRWVGIGANNGMPANHVGPDEYHRVTWNSILVGSGPTYNWSQIDAWLSQCRARGGRLMIGIEATDSSTPADYIPTHLRSAVQEWSPGFDIWFPNWNNATFVQAWRDTYAAMIARYANDPAFGHVECRIWGNWGEGHMYTDNSSLPAPVPYPNGSGFTDMTATNQQAVVTTVLTWPSTKPIHFLGTTGFQQVMNFALQNHDNCTLRRDSMGESGSSDMNTIFINSGTTNRWHKLGPVGERSFRGSGPLAAAQIRALHMTLIGTDLPDGANADYQLAIRQIGYRMSVPDITMPQQLVKGASASITTKWQNDGVANPPIFPTWVPEILLCTPGTSTIVATLPMNGVDPRTVDPMSYSWTDNGSGLGNGSWTGSQATKTDTVAIPSTVPVGRFDARFRVRDATGIGDMNLAVTQTRDSNHSYLMGQIDVVAAAPAPAPNTMRSLVIS